MTLSSIDWGQIAVKPQVDRPELPCLKVPFLEGSQQCFSDKLAWYQRKKEARSVNTGASTSSAVSPGALWSGGSGESVASFQKELMDHRLLS